jgi:hypothetical protein
MIKSNLPTVLIVDNDNGNIFIVENKQTKPQVNKILSRTPKSDHRKIEDQTLE